ADRPREGARDPRRPLRRARHAGIRQRLAARGVRPARRPVPRAGCADGRVPGGAACSLDGGAGHLPRPLGTHRGCGVLPEAGAEAASAALDRRRQPRRLPPRRASRRRMARGPEAARGSRDRRRGDPQGGGGRRPRPRGDRHRRERRRAVRRGARRPPPRARAGGRDDRHGAGALLGPHRAGGDRADGGVRAPGRPRATVNKVVGSAAEATADIPDGATLLIGGFGVIQGWPASLIEAVAARGVRALTVIANTPGVGPLSPQLLAERGLVRKLVASYAVYPTQRAPMGDGIMAGRIALELVPQGTLVERVRAGGAGLPAFYTPTGAGTDAARGREERTFDGRRHVLEHALRGDVALVRAHRADRLGNLTYRRGSRNVNPVFATAATRVIAEVDEIVEPGALDPEAVVTPGIFVDRVVRTERPMDAATVLALSRRWGKQWDLEVRERQVGPRGIPPDLMARKVARLLRRGEYVNLGVGLPTLVSTHIEAAQEITLHSENGML